jgi:hypothetical protein
MGNINSALLFDEAHHLTDEGIALYVDALKLGRTDALPAPIREHVQECLACKQEITGLFALVARSDDALDGAHPVFGQPAPRGRDRRMIYRMAAGIAVFLGLGALTWSLLPHAPDGVNVRQPLATSERIDTTADVGVRDLPQRAAPSSSLLAARFEPSPDLEELVNDGTRSGETVVHQPANGAVLHADIRFSWATRVQPPFTLTVLDNRRHTVHTAQSSADTHGLGQRLQPGLYYWKLSAEGDLLHVGKFIVR